MDMERRSFAIDGLECEKRDDKGPILRGHAAVFGQLSEDLGGFREKIEPGAFADAIGRDDVRALFNHDANFVLGRSGSGTLRLKEDSRGLAFEVDLPNTPTIRDLVVAPITRGDISQMSFGFSVREPYGEQRWGIDDDGRKIRSLKKVKLLDISPVTYPAYPTTDVAMREMRSWESTLTQKTPFNLLRAKEMFARI